MGDLFSLPGRFREGNALFSDVMTVLHAYAGRVSVIEVMGVLELAKVAVFEEAAESNDAEESDG